MTEPARPRVASDVAEDVTGFGASDLRLARDLLLRPRAVLDAYNAGGSTAGGRYPRPLRFYLAVNGLYMLALFLMGGYPAVFPPEQWAGLAGYIADSGKTRDAFMADFDGWASLATVPLLVLFTAPPTVWLLKRWSGRDWRTSWRGGLTLLSAWSLLVLPISTIAYHPTYSGPVTLLMYLLLVATFLRVGRGEWFARAVGGVGKSLLLLLVYAVAGVPAAVLIFGVGILGALFGP